MAKDLNNFAFWCPVEISKAINQETGEEIMRLGGIASTADEDSDGEFLDPKGFDIKPLMESGMVNWHHQAKTCPATIVGEPTKAEIRKEGLYIETDLYPSSQVARDIWELAKTLSADSKTRRLGYSIEGKVVSRKSNDPSSPDYKKITAAVITGVAITHQPKNPKTFANIIKGDIDNDLEEDDNEEATATNDVEQKDDTTTARALIREDVDDKLKVTTFGKADVMEKLFNDLPGITISKAEKIYSLISKISIMARKTMVTDEDIEKAYDALGIAPNQIRKGDTADDDTEDEEVDDTEDEDTEDEDTDDNVRKGQDDDANDDDEEDEDTDDDEEEEDDDEEEDVAKANIFDRFDRIEKAITTSHMNNTKYIKALGVMVKASTDELEKATKSLKLANEQIEDLSDIVKAQKDTINELNQRIESFGSEAPAPKSMRHAQPVERFNKARENEFEKGGNGSRNGNAISINNKRVISELLDQATFSKGFDEEFSKACLSYEASGVLPANIIARLKNEFNVEVVTQ